MHKLIQPAFLLPLLIPSFTHASEQLSGQQSFEFHGYIRSTLGASEDGTTMAIFQAPGARASYRLGNEPDTNLELAFNYNYPLQGQDGAQVEGVFMLDGYKKLGDSNEFTVDHLAQAYLSFNNLLDNNASLWMGRRYYDRKSIHITNYSWLNPGQNSQAGTGIENISMPAGQLNIALFRYEDEFDIASTNYLVNSSLIDARWHSVAIGSRSKLTLWAALAERHEDQTQTYASRAGTGIGGWVDYESGNIKNTAVLLYQTGAAINQGNYNPRPVREDLGWNLDDATAIELSNTQTYENLPDYSLQWTVLAREEDRGTAGNSRLTWYSSGVRPVFYLSQHMNLALEAGVDYIDDTINNREGTLTKFTTALQFSANRGLYSRPVLRFFITLADWSDELKGFVAATPGDSPYASETEGWTIGTQAEVWW